MVFVLCAHLLHFSELAIEYGCAVVEDLELESQGVGQGFPTL
jgi:hypothetical protein